MRIIYRQSTGLVLSAEGRLLAQGWAGRGAGKNNPAMESVRDTGPLPRGTYEMGGWTDHPRLGHMVAELRQIKGDTFGRDGFFIHGPSKDREHYGQESKGCIVLPFTERVTVRDAAPISGCILEVLS